METFMVSLYDKDNDTYLDLFETDDQDQAETICRVIYNLMQTAYVLNKSGKTEPQGSAWGIQLPYEQFDWVEVYNSTTGKVIFVNNEKYKGYP